MNPHCKMCEGGGEVYVGTAHTDGTKIRCPKCYQDQCPGCGTSFPYLCSGSCPYQVHVQRAVARGYKCECGRPVEWHEDEGGLVGYFSGPYLKILCNGDRVKITNG